MHDCVVLTYSNHLKLSYTVAWGTRINEKIQWKKGEILHVLKASLSYWVTFIFYLVLWQVNMSNVFSCTSGWCLALELLQTIKRFQVKTVTKQLYIHSWTNTHKSNCCAFYLQNNKQGNLKLFKIILVIVEFEWLALYIYTLI